MLLNLINNAVRETRKSASAMSRGFNLSLEDLTRLADMLSDLDALMSAANTKVRTVSGVEWYRACATIVKFIIDHQRGTLPVDLSAWDAAMSALRAALVECLLTPVQVLLNGESARALVEMAWPNDFPNAILHTNVATLKAHPDYPAAKAGDTMAAMRVVDALVKPDKLRQLAQRYPEAVLLPVLAIESSGRNKLSLALAEGLSEATGLAVENSTVQNNRTHHTGASGAHRLSTVARFDGQAPPSTYILVDDVITSGGTLAALRLHVEASGGSVVAITALAAAAYGSVVALSAATQERLYSKFPGPELDELLKERGIARDRTDLTNSQATYVLKFGSVGALRGALD